ncbi:helix-turn-helix transcriptional regulator [Mucilaginibacter sp. SP1R1]|uniref:helix-turn-helix transcriptional regulator n=1 Tax=Mucilaginibacter sp. SP1R1 TaxID=2723091 RepID=UPI001613E48C|nr:helix-turn-helix transcriptional regulator [Mucilaginibacter sp. SP1R1]MBB6151924.1 transcriptional regulator with XRE-family HTH domain [Mucilaginibacter sp. SP1R1]
MYHLVGIALRKLRVSHNYSQQYVANYLNISRNAYIDWENTKTHVHIDQLNAICELYNIKLSKFIETYIEEKYKIGHPVKISA